MMTNLVQTTQSAARGMARAMFLATAAIASLALPQSPAAAKAITIPFAASNFPATPAITNNFLPMVPGTTTIFKAEGADGCEEVHVTVTNRTKTIAGVKAIVVLDIAYEDPECDGSLLKVEETFDWYAQDNLGNVWYMGEATKDCTPTGCTPGEGSWEAGVDGAVAGIIMLVSPKSGDQYYQEFYEGFAEDQAKITGVGVKVSLTRDDAIAPGEFTGCLKTKEWTKLDTGFVEQKYYCPGIGLVAVDEHHGKELRFELVTGAAASSSGAFDFRTAPGTR